MKNIALIFILLVIYSCKSDSPKSKIYPNRVKELGIESYYDTAVIEMYRINSCCDCNCFAISDGFNNIDTFNILSLDVALKSILKNNDTLTFIFQFCKVTENNDTTFFNHQGHSYTQCSYNGISFKGKSFSAFPIFLGELKLIDLNNKFKEGAKINFSQCLQQPNLNKNLREYIQNQ